MNTLTPAMMNRRARGRQFSDDEIELFGDAYNRGDNARETAKALGCNQRSVEKWFARFRVEGRLRATRAKQFACHDPYQLTVGPLCRYGDCQQLGTGSPPFCDYHRPKPKAAAIVLPWVVPPERLRAGR